MSQRPDGSCRMGSCLASLKPAPVRRRALLSPLLLARSGQEGVHLEDALLAEHHVDDSAELGGEDRKRLALAVLAGEATQHPLAFGVVAEEEGCGLGEGPLEVDVPHLRACGAEPLASRAVLALDETCVGEEVLDSWESIDVVDLVYLRTTSVPRGSD